ncbi:hypothetical protein [uncultured Gilvimarinus sp.]|uniref:hypothetical protein n=1 Tax=uncultured Gilvimarinus sp. TaxID=1689143 RepID=UPI0030DC1F00
MLTQEIHRRLNPTDLPATQSPEKAAQRQEITQQIKRYLAAGGTIQTLDHSANADQTTFYGKRVGISINGHEPQADRITSASKNGQRIGKSGYRGVHIINGGKQFRAVYLGKNLGIYKTADEANHHVQQAKSAHQSALKH